MPSVLIQHDVKKNLMYVEQQDVGFRAFSTDFV